MKLRTNKIFMMILPLALCVLLFLERLTGGIWHAVLGMILIIFSVVHLCRKNGELKHGKTSVRIIDWALITLLAILFVTGLLLHPFQGVLVLKIIHRLSAVLFVMGLIVHIVQHSRALKKANI